MLYGVKNCIVYFNRSVADPATSNWYLPSYCELMCSCAAPLLPGWGNIVNDPEFINAAAGDYRLAESSLCINVGTNDSGMAWPTDWDGNPRILPVGGVVDIGCYEFVPEPAEAVIVLMMLFCKQQENGVQNAVR